MTKQRIKFKIRKEWDSDKLISHSVMADVKDGWAVHRTVRSKFFWTVTHVKSGLHCGNTHLTESDALASRERLIAVQVNGVPVADLPTCEALAVAPVVARQLAEQDGKDPDKAMHWARKEAAETARIVCPT